MRRKGLRGRGVPARHRHPVCRRHAARPDCRSARAEAAEALARAAMCPRRLAREKRDSRSRAQRHATRAGHATGSQRLAHLA